MESITESYLREQRELHKRKDYGVASSGYAPKVARLIRKYDIKSVCDYGAGKQRLKIALEEMGIQGLKYNAYDPVFPEYGEPVKSQLVCCIDVLEHIEIEFLEGVLDQLYNLTEKLCFIAVHTGPAVKKLSDGRNAHIIQAPNSWWLERLAPRFEIYQLDTNKSGFWFIGSRKDRRLCING